MSDYGETTGGTGGGLGMSDSQRSDYAGRSDYSGDSSSSDAYNGMGSLNFGVEGYGGYKEGSTYDAATGGWAVQAGDKDTPAASAPEQQSAPTSYTPISNDVRQASISNHMAATSKPGEDEYSLSMGERVRNMFTPDRGSYFHTLGVRAPGTSFDEMAANETTKQRDARMREAGNLITNKVTSFMPGMGLINMARTGYAMYDDVANKNLPVTTALGRVAPGVIDNVVNRVTGGLYGQVAGISNELNRFGVTDTSIPSVGRAAWSGMGFDIPGRNTASINTISGGQVTAGGGGYNTAGNETGGWSSGSGSTTTEVPTVIEPGAAVDKPPQADNFTDMRADLDLQGWAQRVRAASQRKRIGG